MISKFSELLNRPINPTIVSIYRIIFGLFMAYQMLYYFSIDYTYQFMAGPEMLFHYSGLSFLKPLPLGILQFIHALLLISTVCITIGWHYRKAMAFFFLGFTYFTFVDKTLYNNHLYLISLISFMMIFIQADVKYSLKAKKMVSSRAITIPAWNQYMLIFLISLPYFYGGIAKLGYNWLGSNLVSEMIRLNESSWLTSVFSEDLLIPLVKYGGLIYDLGIVWLLLFRRTRIFGIALVIFFNVMNNSVLFDDIGLFPFLMICSTILFFSPETVQGVVEKIFPIRQNPKVLSKKEQKRLKKEQKHLDANEVIATTEGLGSDGVVPKNHALTTLLLTVFILLQLFVPLRHYFFTDNPEWYGAGLFFSWRMKMQTKTIVDLNMTLTNTETGEYGPIEAKTFLSRNQYLHLLDDPDNLILLAQYLGPKAGKEYGINKPAISADVQVQFNGLPAQSMIQPDEDLSQLKAEDVSDRSWIIPLKR